MNTQCKRILLFGSGLVSKPVLIYFSAFEGYHVTVVTNDKKAGEELVAGFRAKASLVVASVEDKKSCLPWVRDHDIVLSLLPANLHPIVADYCIEACKHLVTTSYLNPVIEQRSEEVRKKGLIFLNEVGLDPGIDHIVTLKMVEDVRRRGGRVRSLYSYCGGLITPDCIDNPLGYKFSWSPLGVFRALGNSARYLEGGKAVDVPGPDLLYRTEEFNVNNALNIVKYPNRDSTKYRELYKIPEVENLYRGTLRYKGFCEIIAAFKDLGLLRETVVGQPKQTWRGVVKKALEEASGRNARFHRHECKDLLDELTKAYGSVIDEERLIDKLTAHPSWQALSREKATDRIRMIAEGLAFFDLLNDAEPLDPSKTYLENFIGKVSPKMQLKPADSDSVIMTIILEAVYPKASIHESARFQMIINGEKNGLSAMSKTVGLPLAIASKLILDGRISRTGVIGPFYDDVYVPMYKELVSIGLIPQYTLRQFNPKI